MASAHSDSRPGSSPATQPPASKHYEVLVRRLASALGVASREIVEVDTLSPSPRLDSLRSVSLLARRLGATSLDATLTAQALYVAVDLPADTEFAITPGRPHALVAEAWGVPLVMQRAALVMLPPGDKDASGAVAAANLAVAYLARIRALECDSIEGRDPEAVHQLRVAIRRLRTVLRIVEREHESPSVQSVVAVVRKLGVGAGLVRDHDVVLELVTSLDRVSDSDRAASIAYLTTKRADALRRFQRSVGSAAYGETIARAQRVLLHHATSTSSRTLATATSAQIARELRRLSRRFRGDFTQAGGYHDVRRSIRRVRDCADVFSDVLDDRDRRWRKRLQPVQALLGRLNDIDTAMMLAPRSRPALTPVHDELRIMRYEVLAELAAPMAILALLTLRA